MFNSLQKQIMWLEDEDIPENNPSCVIAGCPTPFCNFNIHYADTACLTSESAANRWNQQVRFWETLRKLDYDGLCFVRDLLVGMSKNPKYMKGAKKI